MFYLLEDMDRIANSIKTISAYFYSNEKDKENNRLLNKMLKCTDQEGYSSTE